MTEPSATPTNRVALETTLLVHGVPKDSASALASELEQIVRAAGAEPATVGVVGGKPVVGMNDADLGALLEAVSVPKANTANLGVLMHRGQHAATTVSATMELAAAAGVRVFATGGIGGVHKGYGEHLDISADLVALTRFPVAVVASGVKNLLDVVSTRESLESLGVPVIGFGTDTFPAFYFRDGHATVDARFDDARELAVYVHAELARTSRGILICNPIDPAAELGAGDWAAWLDAAEMEAAKAGATGRAVTPAILGALHRVSGGKTLQANLSLVRSNARLAGLIAAGMPPESPSFT